MLQAQPRLSQTQVKYQDFKSKKLQTTINPINSLFFSQSNAFVPNSNQCMLQSQSLETPIYRGHFINYHYEKIEFNDSYSLSGIQDGFSYFVVNETKIKFYFYAPQTEDLNVYYNNDGKKYTFPFREKEKQIPHIENITAVGFQQTDDLWTMAVASEFQIFLYTFTGDLENFQMLKKGFNTNGEFVNQIIFFQENLIYGGSSGMLTCRSIDTAQNYSMQLKDRLKKQFNRLFKDLVPWTSQIGLVQLEVVAEFNICFGLFEKYDSNGNLEDTSIMIYDLGLNGDCFTEIITIKQSTLYNNNLDIKNQFELQNLQFYHAHFERLSQDQRIYLILTTRDHLQMYLQFEQQTRSMDDFYMFKQKTSLTRYQQLMKIKPEYQVLMIKYPQMKIDQEIPYGVCLDESRTQYKQKEMLTLQSNCILKSVHKEQQLSLFHIDNYIFAQFIDMAHVQYLRSLDSQASKFHSFAYLQQSMYRDTSMEAVEKIDLHGNHESEVPKNLYQIGKMTVHRIFDHSDINESQLYNQPEHYVCVADNTIEFIVRMRPVDCFFTAIKVTHIEFIGQADPDFPLERLVRAFGVEESCSQVLQIIIQEDCQFFTNVELQHQYQLDLEKVYQRIHHSEYISKFYDETEKIPPWVTGNVYVRKGNIVKEKALKAYYSLVSRTLQNDYEERNSKSKKVASTTQLIWKILAPLTTKKFINQQVYNLECNEAIENYSVQQLQIVYRQIDKLVHLFENEPSFYQKSRAAGNDRISDEQKNNQHFKNGFSKYIYETFEQSSRLNSSRATNYTDQSLSISINVDVEHTQMTELYQNCKDIKQLVGFLLYFFGELTGIRNIINSFQNKQQLFELSMKNILTQETQALATLKQLMIHIIKSDKSKLKERAQYMHHHFPIYFSFQDFKISLAQNSFDEILTFAAQKNLIQLNPNANLHEKIKRILKLSKTPQITIDKVLEKQEIFLYYKELQPEMLQPLKEALKTIEEVVCALSLNHLIQSFYNYMYPFATFSYFVQYLAQKCKSLEKDIEGEEYRRSIQSIYDQFDYLIASYEKPPKGLTKLQVAEILKESLQILNQYKLIQTSGVIANKLFKRNMKEFIQYLEYNQDFDIQGTELEKLQIQKKQLVVKAAKGDYEIVLQTIQLLLKLAQFSLAENPEMTLEDIEEKLSLKKRLRYVNKALEFIRIYMKNTQGIDISEMEKLAQNLSKELFLQDIMYDFVVQSENGNQSKFFNKLDYSDYKRRILIELLDDNVLINFFRDNEIWFAYILAMDFTENKNNEIMFSDTQIDNCWISFISSNYDEQFPSEIFQFQFKLIIENLINSNRYLRLSPIIQTIELINTSKCQQQNVTQISGWFFFSLLINYDVQETQIIQIYLNHYKNSDQIQNNPLYQQLEITHVKTYKVQLIQQMLILFESLKNKRINSKQVDDLKKVFRSEFENEYRDFIDDTEYDKSTIDEIKAQIESL